MPPTPVPGRGRCSVRTRRDPEWGWWHRGHLPRAPGGTWGAGGAACPLLGGSPPCRGCRDALAAITPRSPSPRAPPGSETERPAAPLPLPPPPRSPRRPAPPAAPLPPPPFRAGQRGSADAVSAAGAHASLFCFFNVLYKLFSFFPLSPPSPHRPCSSSSPRLPPPRPPPPPSPGPGAARPRAERSGAAPGMGRGSAGPRPLRAPLRTPLCCLLGLQLLLGAAHPGGTPILRAPLSSGTPLLLSPLPPGPPLPARFPLLILSGGRGMQAARAGEPPQPGSAGRCPGRVGAPPRSGSVHSAPVCFLPGCFICFHRRLFHSILRRSPFVPPPFVFSSPRFAAFSLALIFLVQLPAPPGHAASGRPAETRPRPRGGSGRLGGAGPHCPAAALRPFVSPERAVAEGRSGAGRSVLLVSSLSHP